VVARPAEPATPGFALKSFLKRGYVGARLGIESLEMTVKNSKPSKQSNELRSDGDGRQIPRYSIISLIIFAVFLVVFLLLVADAEVLNRFGLTQMIYYLALVPTGIAAAVVLFGVVPSSAEWVGKTWGGTLRLSGPIVCAVLVVFGGHYFIPQPTFFPLTIYVHGSGGPQDLVLRSVGRVFLKLGPEISSEAIAENGQAVFPRIPAEFRGQRVAGWVESDEYEATETHVTIAGDSTDMIVKKKIKHFDLAGTVSDRKGRPLPGVYLELPEFHVETVTDDTGKFKFDITAESQEMTNLVAGKKGYKTVNLRPTLGDPGVNFYLQEIGNAAH
jgi:hypothetical protein